MTLNAEVLEQHRTYLYRYALVHLRDPDRAADAVQETLLAAIAGIDGFGGKSSVRSWLTAIMKHKIADRLREVRREPLLASDIAGDDEDAELGSLFDQRGAWGDLRPREWEHPDQALEQKEFLEVFDQCCRLMPLKTAQAFMLREVMGFTVEEVCKDLGVTVTNCSVMLYRARMRLRLCLETKWFGAR